MNFLPYFYIQGDSMSAEKLKIVVDDKGKTIVWMDGKLIEGIKEIDFNHEVGSYPTHTIKYITQKAGVKNEQ
jgi:acyl CoA:acetate/3-ketoacid CoA transferase